MNDRRVIFLFLPFILGVSFLFLKGLGDFDSFGQMLWAEDGKIFLMQASEFGWQSIFKPHAGYMHLYPRLISYVASFFNFELRPLISSLGWFFSYFFMVYSIVFFMMLRGVKAPLIYLAIFLVTVQPNDNEVFFNITNSQWMLGASLFLLVFSNFKPRHGLIVFFLVFSLSLTGPFSIICMLPLIIFCFLEKNWFRVKCALVPIVLGALVQCFFLLSSGRGADKTINTDPGQWLLAFSRINFFGDISFPMVVVVSFFWFCFLFFVVKRRYYRRVDSSIFLVFCGVLMVVASLWSSKDFPTQISPVGTGSRYSWIPYALYFIAAISVVNTGILGRAFMVCMLTICFSGFKKVERYNLNFSDYANMSKVTNTIIPINPVWGKYPGWYIADSVREDEDHKSISLDIDLKDMAAHNIEVVRGGEFNSLSNDPFMMFGRSISCHDYESVGVELKVYRDQAGWSQLFWKTDKAEFTESNSLRRWYPKGYSLQQYAFNNNGGHFNLRFDPMEHKGHGAIESASVICVGSLLSN
ncbi:hypothetical protein [Larsenimonas rhizosphaerae]|uniref:hypothetical protein n=1 Tax=Larsenimonas rhizosphaerae TaxID=2944682 RepID=UPI002033CC36|nr:hypothetical protein [Larsenimonas rhizosphaerae]MCM2131857.1 hypothetical protein [Larsenimonas rhizosphaerae]